jgi:hypothetical protein
MNEQLFNLLISEFQAYKHSSETKIDSLLKAVNFLLGENRNISKQLNDLHKLAFKPVQSLSPEDLTAKLKMDILNRKPRPLKKAK